MLSANSDVFQHETRLIPVPLEIQFQNARHIVIQTDREFDSLKIIDIE